MKTANHQQTAKSEGAQPRLLRSSDLPYIYRWETKRAGTDESLKGLRCRIVSGQGQRLCTVEFADGLRMATSRSAVVRAKDSKNAAQREGAERKGIKEPSQSGSAA